MGDEDRPAKSGGEASPASPPNSWARLRGEEQVDIFFFRNRPIPSGTRFAVPFSGLQAVFSLGL